jgi:hypothetical protein
MTTALFVNPPWWSAGDDLGDGKFQLRRGVRAGSRWPFTLNASHAPDDFKFGGYIPFPYFLASAAAWAARELADTVDVEFRDSIARGESYKSFNDYWSAVRPTHVILETGAASWEHDKKYIGLMKSSVVGLKVAVAGPPARELSKTTEPGLVDAWLLGEYEKNAVKFINGATGVLEFDLLTKKELDSAPLPYLDVRASLNYWDCNPKGATFPQMQLITSRGCAFACLSGDTPVDTVEGRIPIRELVGREIGVFTYDPKTRKALVATGRKIQQYGTDELVRVHFDDGTHIDCTPDHRFLTFKVGRANEPETPCQAEELKPGMHLRALKFNTDIGGYIDAQWARSSRAKAHRLVAAWKIGRALKPGEHVHHINHVKADYRPENLEVCANAKEHAAKHPEVSERMRERNPTRFGMSSEWRKNMSKANKGKVRTAEAKERYRLAAIKREAAKSPEQKRADVERMHRACQEAKPWLTRTRDLEGKFEPKGIVNHRVTRVERLPGLHPVYCMEVPKTGWFYANNVLVANCRFCSWVHTMSADDPTGELPHPVRFYSPEWVGDYVQTWVNTYPETKSLLIDDDCFNISARHVKNISAVLKEIGLPWSAMCRADTIGRDTWQIMKDSGCFGVKIGFESASQRVIDEVINKRLDLKKAEETCKWLRSIGLTVHTTWTIGSPGETPEEMKLTVDTIERFYAEGVHDTHQLSGTAEIPGTPLATLEKNDPNYVSSPDGAKKLNLIANK